MTTGVIQPHQQATPVTCHFISVISRIIFGVSATRSGLFLRRQQLRGENDKMTIVATAGAMCTRDTFTYSSVVRSRLEIVY